MTPRKRVLLIDDEALLRKVLARQLEQLGYEVRAAASAEEGLELARGGGFDAVLLDNVMPGGMSGLQALPKLLELSSAPVLLMSGHCDEDFKKDARLLGASAVLSKPMGADDISRELRKALGE